MATNERLMTIDQFREMDLRCATAASNGDITQINRYPAAVYSSIVDAAIDDPQGFPAQWKLNKFGPAMHRYDDWPSDQIYGDRRLIGIATTYECAPKEVFEAARNAAHAAATFLVEIGARDV